VQGEGAASNNPVIVQKIPITMTGMEEGRNRVRIEELEVQPNPSTGKAQIHYALPAPGHVELGVFDLAGREVAKLERGHQAEGRYSVDWHAEGQAKGIYLIELRAGDKVLVQKLVLQ